jgi:hypothetical protein
LSYTREDTSVHQLPLTCNILVEGAGFEPAYS